MMKSRVIALALATAALGFGGLAHAHDDGYRDWRQAQHRQFQENWFYQQQLEDQRRQFDQRRYERRHRHGPRYLQPQYDRGGSPYAFGDPWGARVPQYHYRRGDYLPD